MYMLYTMLYTMYTIPSYTMPSLGYKYAIQWCCIVIWHATKWAAELQHEQQQWRRLLWCRRRRQSFLLEPGWDTAFQTNRHDTVGNDHPKRSGRRHCPRSLASCLCGGQDAFEMVQAIAMASTKSRRQGTQMDVFKGFLPHANYSNTHTHITLIYMHPSIRPPHMSAGVRVCDNITGNDKLLLNLLGSEADGPTTSCQTTVRLGYCWTPSMTSRLHKSLSNLCSRSPHLPQSSTIFYNLLVYSMHLA